MCVNACPLGNVTFSSATRQIVKCDLCDGDPQCAKYCPSGCLVYTEDNDALGRKRAMGKALMEVFGTGKEAAA
jgi:Fe-S-cluster-containing hydrogenase component 2